MKNFADLSGAAPNGVSRLHASHRAHSTRMVIPMLLLGLVAVCCHPIVVRAQVPRMISYQGVLATDGAEATGSHLLTVALYGDSIGGTPLYEESHQVTVVNGLFEMEIGSISPIPPTVSFDQPYYLGVSVDGNPELTPRVPLDAAPYALTAGTAQVAEGLTPNAHGVVTSINELAGPIRITGDSVTVVSQEGNTIVIHAKPSVAQGIQSVASPDNTVAIANGTGPDVSVGVADAAITTLKLANAAVTPQKLAQAGATPGQVLKWNGTAWAVSNDSVGTRYLAGQGISISGNVISASGFIAAGTVLNSTLRWNGSSWTENSGLRSDSNGNTWTKGATNLGDGSGSDNITMNPGSGQVQVTGWSPGVVVSNAAGVLSTSQITGGSGITIARGLSTITIADTNTPGWGRWGNSGTTPGTNFLGTTDSRDLVIKTNATEAMRVTSAGAIGIGTAMPSEKLNVSNGNFLLSHTGPTSDTLQFQGTSTGSSNFIAGAQGATTVNYTLPTSQPISNQTLTATSISGSGPYNVSLSWTSPATVDTGWGRWGNSGTTPGTNFLGTTDNEDLVIKTNATEALRVTSAGAIGIGTSTPSNKLDIANGNLSLSRTGAASDTLKFQGTSTGSSNFIAGAQGATTVNYTLPTSQPGAHQVLAATSIAGMGPYNVALGWSTPISDTGWGTTGNSGTTAGTNFLGTTDDQDLVIKTNSAEVMRVSTWGDVGIGTSSPSQRLSICNGNIFLSRTGWNGPDVVQFEGTSTGTSSIAAGAQGTTSIEYTLPTSAPTTNQVLTAASVTGTTPYQVALAWTSGTTADSGWGLWGNSGTTPGTNFLGTTDNKDLVIKTNATEALRVTSAGAIGIGTTTPSEKLNVSNGNFLLSHTGATSDTLQFQGTSTGSSNFIAGMQGATTVNYTLPTSQPSANQVLTATNVTGTGPYIVTLNWSSPTGGTGWGLTGNSGTTEGTNFIGTTDNADLVFKTNSTEAMRIENTGEIGIGTNMPTAKVEISNGDLFLSRTGSSTDALKFQGTSTGTSSFTAGAQGTTSIAYTLPTAAPVATGNLLWTTSGTSSAMGWSTGLVWDNTDSRLGIGTTSPADALQSVYSGTTDEYAAIQGTATGSTSNQSIGLWGSANSTSTSNTGTIGVLATGNGNTTAGNTNVALQINDGEFTMGRTTETPSAGTDVDASTGGTAYSQQGPSGVVELTLGALGNLATSAPTSGTMQDLGSVTIDNRYCESGSIVLTNVVAMIDDGSAPNPQDAAWILNVASTTSGSFVLRIKMIPATTSASNYSTSDKIRVGYVIVNKSK